MRVPLTAKEGALELELSAAKCTVSDNVLMNEEGTSYPVY